MAQNCSNGNSSVEMMRPHGIRVSAACLLMMAAFAGFAGCGDGNSGPKTVRISGIVYMDDKPLEGALVTFTTKDFAGMGRTNAEGRYELTQGAVPGPNKVFISKIDQGDIELDPEGGMDEGQLQAMQNPAAGPGKKTQLGPKQLIPDRYSDEAKSELTYPVPDGGAREADFRLQSK